MSAQAVPAVAHAAGLVPPPLRNTAFVVCDYVDRPGMPAATVAAASASMGGDDAPDPTCYVLECKRSPDGGVLAVALSNREVKLYNAADLAYRGTLRGHTAAVHGICFAADRPGVLYSCSLDGTVRVWDAGTCQQVSCLTLTERGTESISMDLGCGGRCLAAATETQLRLWDMHTGALVGGYAECHTEPITMVRWHPKQPTQLLSAAEDGLVCVYDTSVADEEEAVLGVMNVDSSVARVGFFGPDSECLFVLTHTETLSLWNIEEVTRLQHYGTLRDTLAAGGMEVDYLVDCAFDAATLQLYLVAGNHAGDCFLLRLLPERVEPVAAVSGAHRACVRCAVWDSSALVTGGEDGRLCLWQPEGGAPARESPATRAMKGRGGAQRPRFSPY